MTSRQILAVVTVLLAIGLVIRPQALNATAVYAFRTPDRLYVEADSLIETPGLTSTASLHPMCKLATGRRFVLGFAGLGGHVTAWRDQKTQRQVLAFQESGFRSSAESILARENKPEATMDSLIAALKQSLRREASAYRAAHQAPSSYLYTQIVLFWWEGGSIRYEVADVSVVPENQQIKFDTRRNSSAEMLVYGVVGIGRLRALQERQRPSVENPTFDPRRYLDTLVSRQSELTPQAVGRPFTVVELSSTGDKWLQPKPCRSK